MTRFEAGRDNLIETYCALASVMPQTRIERFGSTVISTGPFAHPLCNFAVLIDGSEIPRIVRASAGRAAFSIYTFENSFDLGSAGFRIAQELDMMSHPEPLPPAERVEPVPASSRMEVARFMSEQFFVGQKADLKARIAEANALAKNLEFFVRRNERTSRIEAAGIVHQTGRVGGLYNVCVDERVRGRGVGSDMMRQLMAVCASRNCVPVLQCGGHLTGWYEQFGFQKDGVLKIWSMLQNAVAIM